MRLDASDIVEWKNFNLKNLLHIYGEILKIPANKLPNFSWGLPFHLVEIKDEDSLEALLIRWNNAIISCALLVAQRAGEVDNLNKERLKNEEIYMARDGQACFPSENKIESSYRPDWTGIIPGKFYSGTRCNSYINLLPGDTKLSSKWATNSKRFLSQLEFQKPWRQIFQYCLAAKVRYGYLLTQEELVVVRISTKTGGPSYGSQAQAFQRPQRTVKSKVKKLQNSMHLKEDNKDKQKARGFLEYKSIPWKSSNSSQNDGLSINLALWWLHMMASKSRSIETNYLDLQEEYKTSYQASSRASTANPNSGSLQARGKKRARKEFDSKRSSSSKGEMEPPRKMQRSFSGPMQVD